jgi:ABC-2 type transport system ATP-binding protein
MIQDVAPAVPPDAAPEARPTRAMIETFGLTKRFSTLKNYRALLRFRRQETLTAVDAVTLRVHAGEVFGLLGPNGAGKTTLVKLLCSLILPSAGRALIAGRDVVAEAAAARRCIGLIDCQERSFFWRLTGRQNLEFFAAIHNLQGAVAQRRIDEVLALVGLRAAAERKFMHYSTGMRQKLAIARGLLPMPPILLMDEPTRSLDPVAAHDLRRFIRETLVGELGRTVLLVTHHLEEAEELCTRVAIMNRGQIIAGGTIAAIRQQVTARQRYHLQVQHLRPTLPAHLRELPGVVQADWSQPDATTTVIDLWLSDERTALPEVLRLIVQQGGDIQQCHAGQLSLEEVFMSLVRETPDEG